MLEIDFLDEQDTIDKMMRRSSTSMIPAFFAFSALAVIVGSSSKSPQAA
jgi:hypothetical protein